MFTFNVACWLQNAANVGGVGGGEEERTCHVVAVEPIGKALLTWQEDQGGGALLFALPLYSESPVNISFAFVCNQKNFASISRYSNIA